MRKYWMLAAVAMIMAIPATASAIPPEVVFVEESDDEFVVPAGELCEFDVLIHETVRIKVTEYFNKDGSLSKALVKAKGTTSYTSSTGTATEHWSWSGIFDPVAETFTQNGNVFNVHAGAGGIVVNDKGRVVFDDTTGEVLVINGPHQALEEGLGALCEVLAP